MPIDPAAPPVLKWYRIYAGLMAALYVICLLATLLVFFYKPSPQELQDFPLWAFKLFIAFLAVLCGGLAFLYIYAFFLPNTSGAWIYHLVLICIGLTSACCMLVSIPLLIFWLREDTQAYFGRRPRLPSPSP